MSIKKEIHKIVAATKYPVIAAITDDEKRYTLVAHSCPSCKTALVTNKMQAPVCPSCNSTMQRVTKKEMILTSAEIRNTADFKKVAEIEDAGYSLYASADLADKLIGKTFYSPLTAEELTGEDFSEADEMSEEEIDWSAGAGSEDDMPADESDEDMSDEMSEDESDEDMSDESEDESEEEDFEIDEEDAGDESESFEDEPVDTASAEDDNALTASAKKQKKIEANSLHWFKARTKGAKDFDLAMSGGENPKWWLFANATPVAFATKTKASSKFQEIFATAAFAKAFAAVANDGLTDQNLNEFGFEPTQTSIPVEDATAQAVEQKVNEATKQFEEKIANTAKVFDNCVGIAAVGSLKKVLPIANPLHAAIVATLKDMGHKHPTALTDKLFRQHGEAYLKNIVAKAMELTQKPIAALSELADVVKDAEYQEPKSVADSSNIRVGMIPDEISQPSNDENHSIAASYSPDGTVIPFGRDAIKSVVASLGRK